MNSSSSQRIPLAEHKARPSLAEEFQDIRRLCDSGPMTLATILNQIENRGQALFTLFLAGPFVLPIPLPGVSIPFGVVIVIFGISLATNTRPWLPRAIMERPLPLDSVRKFAESAARFFARTQHWFKARWPWLVEHPVTRRLAGLLIISSGMLLALPLPPGTNFPPAASIVCLSIGLLESDGLLLIVGCVIFVLNVLFFILLFTLGYEVMFHFVPWAEIKDYFFTIGD